MTSGNEDKLKGTGKTVEGNLKKEAGKLLNDPEMEAEGHFRKAEGQAQKLKGEAKKAMDK